MPPGLPLPAARTTATLVGQIDLAHSLTWMVAVTLVLWAWLRLSDRI